MKVVFIHGSKSENLNLFPELIPNNLTHVLVECPKSGEYTQEQLRQISDCDAIFVSGGYITQQIFQAARKLKVVQTANTGFDKLDIKAATRHGIICCNNAGMNSSRVADFAMMHTVSLFRNFVPTITAMNHGRNWEAARKESNKAFEVEGKTLGIMGFGNVGHKLASRAHSFDMRIVYFDVDKNAHIETARRIGARLMPKEDVFAAADLISVHVPKDATTIGMIGDREFALMKDGVFIIQTSRGGIIDEAALRRALDSGKVAAAAVDVFSEEPIGPGNPLMGAPNIVMTPHAAARGKEGVVRSFNAAVANMLDCLNGKKPKNIINPEAMNQPQSVS